MANRKKVLFLITKSNPGGAQRYVRDLATALPREEFEAVVIAGTGTYPESGWLHQELNSQNIRTVSLTVERNVQNPFAELKRLWTIFSLIRKERPHILHLNSAKVSGLGAVAGRLLNTPLIVFAAHGWSSNEKRPLWARIIILFFEWLTIMFAHKTLMNSEATYAHVKQLPFVRQKSVLIRLGIDTFTPLSRAAARHELGIPENLFVIGSIAEHHQNKGLDILIDALPLLPETHAYLIGDGVERKSLESQIHAQNVADRAHLLGAIGNAKKYITAFDIFVLPSRTESLGYVLLEAGIAKVPVVGTRVGGIPEIIVHEETGLLVESENSALLASAITRLKEDAELQTKLSANLYKKVTEEFLFDTTLQKTLALYRDYTPTTS